MFPSELGFVDYLLDQSNLLTKFEKLKYRSVLQENPNFSPINILKNYVGISEVVIQKSIARFMSVLYVDKISQYQVSNYIYDVDVSLLKSYHSIIVSDISTGSIFILTPNPFLTGFDKMFLNIKDTLSAKYSISDLQLGIAPQALIDIYYNRYSKLISDINEGSATVETRDEVKLLLDKIIITGMDKGASDIHLQPRKSDGLITFRIDGDVVEFTTVDISLLNRLIKSVINSENTSLTSLNKTKPRQGVFRYVTSSLEQELRLNILPAEFGFDLNLRYLYKDVLTLDKLGYTKSNLQIIMEQVTAPSGLVLFVGSVGSGKSTSIYSILYSLKKGRTICTVEDPVEHQIEGITQVMVNSNISYSDAIQSFLRHDPNIISIGEIRSPEVANDVIIASETGHLVISTLHSKNTVSTISRLRGLGVSNLNIAENLRAVVAQKLIKIKHKDCGGVGCSQCDFTGEKGRTVLTEILIVSKEIKEAIMENKPSMYISELAKRDGSIFRSYSSCLDELILQNKVHDSSVNKYKKLIQELEV